MNKRQLKKMIKNWKFTYVLYEGKRYNCATVKGRTVVLDYTIFADIAEITLVHAGAKASEFETLYCPKFYSCVGCKTSKINNQAS